MVHDRWLIVVYIPKQPEESVSDDVGSFSKFSSSLAPYYAQWSLAPDENFEKPPCQIPDSSGCFGISLVKVGRSAILFLTF